MEQRLSMVTLGVDDLAAARAFFEAGLGWRPAGFDSDAIVFYQTGTAAIALFGRQALAEDAGVAAAGQGFSGVTIAWNGRSEAEVDCRFRRSGRGRRRARQGAAKGVLGRLFVLRPHLRRTFDGNSL